VRLPPGLVPAAVVRRLNRFAVEVSLSGSLAVAHLPNSGRVRELLAPGTPALLAPRPGPGRKTPFDLLLVRLGETWVSADARLPNALAREALARGAIEPLAGLAVLRSEVAFGESRVDFLLEGGARRCLLETKSVTLVEDGVALFPDAPTARGTRHLRDLLAARQQGLEAAVLFVVQRPDAREFRPHEAADPAFSKALRQAAAAGVAVLAYGCDVSPQEVQIAARLPVRL
jgi:sugar fermentation stimulation protein A